MKRRARLAVLAALASMLGCVAIVRAQTDPDVPPEPPPDEPIPDEPVPLDDFVFDMGEDDGGEWDPCPSMAAVPEEAMPAARGVLVARCSHGVVMLARAQPPVVAIARRPERGSGVVHWCHERVVATPQPRARRSWHDQATIGIWRLARRLHLKAPRWMRLSPGVGRPSRRGGASADKLGY